MMLMVNDATDEMDSGRQQLDRLLEHRAAIKAPGFNALSEEDQKEQRQGALMAEQLAKAHFLFADDVLDAFTYYTTEIVAPFSQPELAQRLAQFLNLNMKLLSSEHRYSGQRTDTASGFTDSECAELGLDRAKLLSAVLQVYVQVMTHRAAGKAEPSEAAQTFLSAVAQDRRSFDLGVLAKVVDLLSAGPFAHHPNAVPPAMIQSLRRLFPALKKAGAAAEQEEHAFDDAPDHFLDALLFTVMRDPVMLPSSKQVMDRSNVVQHLLGGDQIDPFNRSPLEIADVIPMGELRTEIEAWLEEKAK